MAYMHKFNFFIVMILIQGCTSVSSQKPPKPYVPPEMEQDYVRASTAIELGHRSFIRGCQEGLKLAGQHPSIERCQAPYQLYSKDMRDILDDKKD